MTPQQQSDLDKVEKLMRTPMDHYNTARQSNEIDLVGEVRQRLVQAGLGDRLPAAFDNNRFILEAQGRTSHAQLYNLNRYFVLQFMAATDDAQIQRYSLVNELNAAQWLVVFDSTILPALVDFDLPVVL